MFYFFPISFLNESNMGINKPFFLKTAEKRLKYLRNFYFLVYWLNYRKKMKIKLKTESLNYLSNGVPVVAQQIWIQLGNMRLWVWSLASLKGLRIWCCNKLWCRLQMRLGYYILWLWRKPEAVVPIRPLACEPPYATGAALKSKIN